MIHEGVVSDGGSARARALAFAGRALRNGSAASILETLGVTVILLLVFRIVVAQASLTVFGIWALTQSLTSLVRMADVGVSASLSKFIGQIDPRDRHFRVWPYVDSALAFNLLFYGVLSLVAYVPLAWGLRQNLPADQAALAVHVLPFILLNLILSSLQAGMASALVGMLRGTAKSVITLASSVVLLIGTIVLLPRYGLLGLALAQTAQMAFSILLSWADLSRAVDARRRFRFGLRVDLSILRETLGLSVNMQVNNLIGALYETVLKLALSTHGGAESVGLYELTDRFIRLGRSLVFWPVALSIPVIARALAAGKRRVIRRIHRRQMLLTFVTCIVLFAGIALATPIASLLVLRRFDTTFFLFMGVVWVASFINAIGTPTYMLGLAAGRLKGNYAGNIVALVGAGIFANLGGALYGPVGALVGGASLFAIGSVLTMVLNSRMFGVDLLPRMSDLAALRSRAALRRMFGPVLD